MNTLSLLLDPTIKTEELKENLLLFYLKNKNQTKEDIIIDKENTEKSEKYEPKLITKKVFIENWEIKQEKSLESFFLTVYGEDHPILQILKVLPLKKKSFIFLIFIKVMSSINCNLLPWIFFRNLMGIFRNKI